MYHDQKHLDDLHQHLELVQRNCRLLVDRALEAAASPDRLDFARVLLAHAHVHDASKFHGIEWEFLHRGPDTPGDKLVLAVRQHQATNPHHPEYWGGMVRMPEVYVAEMVCDWLARAQEMGTNLIDWIETTAVPRFGLTLGHPKRDEVFGFVALLVPPKFVR